MEMVLCNGFNEISQDKMMEVEGGGFFSDVWNETCKVVTSFASGAVVGAKVGSATCVPAGAVAGVIVGGVVSVVWDYAF